ncbi:MAG: BtrH N-terminal domain-containing protein [Chloroflexi bacterium]|nr:BtrH N-terminal domain-containing protein [Chloroflexota bacterium]MCI0578588.1 BtrH N-terminal domain-containing protein [Chloroflexota bacterium]MCI0647347.1 BtrH N-terminal domain-containing protein [Chloroflexota bacterium]MCI0727807.1 BtrH N-terminal domain-containing protein [Chloroflexota bacterium]
MMITTYRQFGGRHPETAAIKNILAAKGVVAPHTGRPFSEAMLLGIGGGLGIGYILWEFKAHETAILVLAFGYKWNYPVEYMTGLARRAGMKAVVKETGGMKAAGAQLREALQAGQPATAWVDPANLPYFHLPALYDGCLGHVVTVAGLEDGCATLDDRSQRPLTVEAEALAAARARIASYKNRLLLLEPGEPFDLETAIWNGIGDCLEYLGGSSTTFALPVILKWARLLTDTRNQKGWPVVFKNRVGLYTTLKSIFEGIELGQTGGGGLRDLYASFLVEAGDVANRPELRQAANQYRGVAGRWSALAQATLPDEVPVFRETKELLTRRYELLIEQGRDAFDGIAAISGRINELDAALKRDFPLDDKGVQQLFAGLQEHLVAIHQAEKEALAALSEAYQQRPGS